MSWITDIIEGIGKLITGSRDPKPKRFNRAHVWRSWRLRRAGEDPSKLVALDPPVCDYCGQEQTLSNEYLTCPGPRIEA